MTQPTTVLWKDLAMIARTLEEAARRTEGAWESFLPINAHNVIEAVEGRSGAACEFFSRYAQETGARTHAETANERDALVDVLKMAANEYEWRVTAGWARIQARKSGSEVAQEVLELLAVPRHELSFNKLAQLIGRVETEGQEELHKPLALLKELSG